MKIRLALLLSSVVLAANQPSFARESWNCRVSDLTGLAPKGSHNSVKIEINGGWLDWKIEVGVLGPDFRPVPDGHGGYKLQTVTFRKRILENNDIGIVAADPQSRIDPQIGPLIGSEITIVWKATGELYDGSVMLNGPHALMNGQCKRNSETPTFKPGH